MDLRSCLCDEKKRNEVARGVASSVGVIGLDADAHEQIVRFAETGTPAQKNYL